MTQGAQHRTMSNDLITDHLNHLAAGGAAQTTIDYRRGLLQRLSRDLPMGLAFAATEQVEAWLARLRDKGRAQNTLSIYGYHIKSFYDWVCEAGFLDGNPVATIKWARSVRGLPHPVSEAELAQVLGLAEPLRTAVILAAFEGYRRAEITASRREDITPERCLIPDGKGGQPRYVPTHPYVWQHLHDRDSGPLIRDRRGKPVTPTWLGQRARYAFDAIGLPEVRLHRFRHRYGTLIQQLYGDIRVTQECLGHKRISTTEVYTQVTGDRKTAAVRTLPVPGSGTSAEA
jgi:integrase